MSLLSKAILRFRAWELAALQVGETFLVSLDLGIPVSAIQVTFLLTELIKDRIGILAVGQAMGE